MSFMKNYSNNQGQNYNLSNNNCTDLAISTLNHIGLSIPDSYGSWPFGGGSNPGNLGEEIRDYNHTNYQYQKNEAGGYAVSSNCL